MNRISGLFALAALVLSFTTPAAPPALAPQPFVSGLVAPTEIGHPNDDSGRLFVTEARGTVRVIRDGALLPVPFLDITPLVKSGGEQGLLGLAFHPSYMTNGRFFVCYTRALPGDDAGNEIAIQRYQRSAANPDVALYQPDTLDHLCTTDANEYATLQEGIDGYMLPRTAAGTAPLYRPFLPGTFSHLWTWDPNERSVLVQRGWADEGIAGHVLPLP
jgi:uncharacterized protein DUF5648/glucose/sorbosone dehydrogenase